MPVEIMNVNLKYLKNGCLIKDSSGLLSAYNVFSPSWQGKDLSVHASMLSCIWCRYELSCCYTSLQITPHCASFECMPFQ